MTAYYGVSILSPRPEWPELSSNKDERREAQAVYKNLNKIHLKHLLYGMIGVGLLVTLLGGFIPVPSLSIGFVLGGVICFLWGNVQAFGLSENLYRFLAVFISLLWIIGLGCWFTRNRDQ